MPDKHISSQFDVELNSISTHVLEMGGLVESQLHQAVYALEHMSLESADQVLENENRINQMESSRRISWSTSSRAALATVKAIECASCQVSYQFQEKV